MTRPGRSVKPHIAPSAPVPTVVVTADVLGHYRWGDGCDGWRLTRDDALSVIEELMPPGTAEILHLHRRARQFFYVLEGHARMRLADGPVDLPAGHGVEVDPGAVHQMRNDSDRLVRFLAISSPTTRGDREEGDWND